MLVKQRDAKLWESANTQWLMDGDINWYNGKSNSVDTCNINRLRDAYRQACNEIVMHCRTYAAREPNKTYSHNTTNGYDYYDSDHVNINRACKELTPTEYLSNQNDDQWCTLLYPQCCCGRMGGCIFINDDSTIPSIVEFYRRNEKDLSPEFDRILNIISDTHGELLAEMRKRIKTVERFIADVNIVKEEENDKWSKLWSRVKLQQDITQKNIDDFVTEDAAIIQRKYDAHMDACDFSEQHLDWKINVSHIIAQMCHS